jgi:DNA-binding MarR family transcriptional regulator
MGPVPKDNGLAWRLRFLWDLIPAEVVHGRCATSGFRSCHDKHLQLVLIRYNPLMNKLTLSDYESLAQLRYQIRRFVHFSEDAAREAGLEPRQQQLLLALKGLPRDVRPRIAELAERLQIQHHSAVELVNRLVAGGYVRRRRTGEDRREVLLELTAKSERVLRNLALHHKHELRRQGPDLVRALKHVMGDVSDSRSRSSKSPRSAKR